MSRISRRVQKDASKQLQIKTHIAPTTITTRQLTGHAAAGEAVLLLPKTHLEDSLEKPPSKPAQQPKTVKVVQPIETQRKSPTIVQIAKPIERTAPKVVNVVQPKPIPRKSPKVVKIVQKEQLTEPKKERRKLVQIIQPQKTPERKIIPESSKEPLDTTGQTTNLVSNTAATKIIGTDSEKGPVAVVVNEAPATTTTTPAPVITTQTDMPAHEGDASEVLKPKGRYKQKM